MSDPLERTSDRKSGTYSIVVAAILKANVDLMRGHGRTAQTCETTQVPGEPLDEGWELGGRAPLERMTRHALRWVLVG